MDERTTKAIIKILDEMIAWPDWYFWHVFNRHMAREAVINEWNERSENGKDLTI